jgi:glycosyltransferase involved in cell wall biosynthesis
MAYSAIQMDLVSRLAGEFDIIHFHTDFLHFPITRNLHTPHLTTLHGRLDLPELVPLYRHFPDIPLVSISNSQRMPLPWANWLATVYHGLPVPALDRLPAAEKYFAFIGRISPEKRVDRAIEIAAACGVPLIIAAKIDSADQAYFDECIRPLLHSPSVRFIGEINEQQKHDLLIDAAALLFPIDWPEPFGLVMIEAFSFGTPVIAYRHGSIAEIMEEGVTGFIVQNQQQAIDAAHQIDTIDRAACRRCFERRFSAATMAENYLHVYQALLSRDRRGKAVTVDAMTWSS